jgi:hypothetical protein
MFIQLKIAAGLQKRAHAVIAIKPLVGRDMYWHRKKKEQEGLGRIFCFRNKASPMNSHKKIPTILHFMFTILKYPSTGRAYPGISEKKSIE